MLTRIFIQNFALIDTLEIEEKIVKWSNQTYSERGNRSNMTQAKENTTDEKRVSSNPEDKKLVKENPHTLEDKSKEKVYSVKI